MITFKDKPNSKSQIDHILNPTVKKWFYSKFKEYSLPQLMGVFEIHSRKNVLVSAPTGATKTLTGFLSILNELVDSAEKGILENRVYCVYISPLKALNYDIQVNLLGPLAEIEAIVGKKLGIRVGVRTGDTTPKEKQQMLKNPPHILITTPESLAIMLSTVKFKDNLKNVEWCIIDEVHALADNKRGTHLSISLERLSILSTGMTRVGLSATIAPIESIAKYLVGQKLDPKKDEFIENDCTIIDVQFIKELDLKVLSPVPDLINTSHELKHKKMYELIHGLVQKHKTTLIFTNTRAATERVVDYLKDKHPRKYTDNIGAHHGSLSKELRHDLESRMRKGRLKVVVSSTSLELGIDVGFIDLVILLGSPKSVARALQRVGRSGHKLHSKTKGRIIVLDRDDLVECSVLLKSAVEKKIDKIHIPDNAMDVLAQQIYGIAIADQIHFDELFNLIKQSYSYRNLTKTELMETIKYLAGEYTELENRHVYAKIWYDPETKMIGRKGKMARVIYMTNIGTIPDESFITVKVGTQVIGHLDEGFLERLRRGDVFVLGGQKYEFLFARGMVAQVNSSVDRPPTIPSWISEMLPLSFDLGQEIGRFRRLISEMMCANKSKSQVIKFIHDYLYVDDNAANAIYVYIIEQYLYVGVPHDKLLLIERYNDDTRNYYIFHTTFGRRVNDALSRAFAYAISRIHHKDVEMNVNDNGFYLTSETNLQIGKAVEILKGSDLNEVLNLAIDKSEVLGRRFRHCAGRSLMILRNYKGRTKRVGRQQVSSMQLINAVRRISKDFPILKEARREVLHDLMDIEHAKLVIDQIIDGKIKVEQIETNIPSPFAFNLMVSGYADILRIEDKTEFLKKMHQMVLAKISLKKKQGEKVKEIKDKEQLDQDQKGKRFSYDDIWDKEDKIDDETNNLIG